MRERGANTQLARPCGWGAGSGKVDGHQQVSVLDAAPLETRCQYQRKSSADEAGGQSTWAC